MSQSLSIPIDIRNTTLAGSLRGQLVNTDGTVEGSALSSGFTNLGNGCWLFEVTVEDEWRGGLSIYDSPDDYEDSLAVCAINPDLHATVEPYQEMLAFAIGTYTVATGLKVQLKESDGTNYGDVLTDYIDLGNGNLLWYIEDLLDFRGVAVLFDGTTWSTSNTVAVASVNQIRDTYDIESQIGQCRFWLNDSDAAVWTDNDIEKALVQSTESRSVDDGVPLIACSLLYDIAAASAATRARIQRAALFSIDYTKLPQFLRDQANHYRSLASVFGGADVPAGVVGASVRQTSVNIPDSVTRTVWDDK